MNNKKKEEKFVTKKQQSEQKIYPKGNKKRNIGRHVINHALAKNRYKRLGLVTVFLTLAWVFLLLAIINKGFIYISGNSILSDLFTFIFESVIFRIFFFASSIWIFIDLSRTLGQASVTQPFGRFVKHLNTVHSSGGEKFILRGKDIFFVQIAIAFNQMINRLKHENEKRKERCLDLVFILESRSNILTKEEKKILERFKVDLLQD